MSCDDYCCNYGCNQGRNCPARKTPAKATERAPAPRAAPVSSGFEDMDGGDIPFISCDWALEVETSKAKRMRRYDF